MDKLRQNWTNGTKWKNKIGKMDKTNKIHTILIKSTKLVKLENEQNWTNDLKMA